MELIFTRLRLQDLSALLRKKINAITKKNSINMHMHSCMYILQNYLSIVSSFNII